VGEELRSEKVAQDLAGSGEPRRQAGVCMNTPPKAKGRRAKTARQLRAFSIQGLHSETPPK
jgi:hypothetical protein